MQEYIFFFRWMKEVQPSPEQMPDAVKGMMDWMGDIDLQQKLAGYGNSLGEEGKVVRANGLVTDGPYAEIKEALGGYIIVRADDMDDAVSMAAKCPLVKGGGNIEIRPVAISGKMNEPKNS